MKFESFLREHGQSELALDMPSSWFKGEGGGIAQRMAAVDAE